MLKFEINKVEIQAEIINTSLILRLTKSNICEKVKSKLLVTLYIRKEDFHTNYKFTLHPYGRK